MARRSPRVVWLPQDNENSIPLDGTTVYQRAAIDVFGTPGSFAVGEIPLVIDRPQDPAALTTSLSDIGNSGYRLRRIVGKIFCSANQVDADTPVRTLLTCGIIVRRVNEGGASLAILTGNAATLSPGEIQNTEDPWIWRRTWLLGNPLATAAALTPIRSIATVNYASQGGSAVDGPHVDQKTARVIGPEERLFLTFSSTILEAGTDQELSLGVEIVTDLRILGSLRTTSGNRRNASR